MPWYTDHNGNTVSPTVALDASGNVRPGYRRAASDVLQDGERFTFDPMMMDGRASLARSAVFLTDVIKPMDAAAVVAAIRDARYIAPPPAPSRAQRSAPEPLAPAISVADNSHVASALRTARYL